MSLEADKATEDDIKLDEKADRQLTEIRRLQREIRTEMEAMKKSLKRVEKNSGDY